MQVIEIAVSAGIAGVVQAFIGVFTYKLIDRQDKKIDTLSERIQHLEDEKIKGIQERLDSGSEEFDAITGEFKDTLHRGDFAAHQAHCDKRFDGISSELKQADEKFLTRREFVHIAATIDKINDAQQRQQSRWGDLATDVATIKGILETITRKK